MNRLYKAVLAISLALWTGAAPARSALAADTHEQQWIVDSIGRDVTEIVLFAAKKRGSADVDFDKLSFETTESQIDNAGFKYQYRMENPSLAQDSAFAIDDYVFASRNYLPWIEQLLARYKLSGEVSKEANASGSEELISKLSNFTDADIAIENKRITTALTEHPLDASLHEQAALLVALYGWRESAACFTDVRPWMNRIAAHLALATALQGAGKRTAAGDLANAVLLTLCKRQSDALAVAESISSGHPSEALSSWMRALKVRNTGDYRLADIKRATTVEKLEYARGLADDISTDSMSDYLDKEKIDTQVVPDWDRIALRGLSSVEAGHRYAIPSLKTEMDSYMADCAIYKKSSIKSSEEAVQGLSLRPTRCLIDDDGWKLEPVSWPDLADFHSRHILDSIYQTFHFVHHMWGVPEQAEALVAHADKTFAEVRLYPFCQVTFAAEKRAHADTTVTEKIKKLLVEHPEDVNCDLWQLSRRYCQSPDMIPAAESWFVPPMLEGTAYDLAYRQKLSNCTLDLSFLNKLKALAGCDKAVGQQWALAKYGKKASGDQLMEAYGRLFDYDVSVMEKIADATVDDSAKHAVALEHIAEYKPIWYFALGQMYIDQDNDEKARVAYENGVRLCRDPVGLSNCCAWLVTYYFAHNQKEKALKLAQQSAEVYSSAGLTMLADLYERMGKLPDAEKYYQMDFERYEDPDNLTAFYVRNQAKNPKYKEEADRRLKKTFPAGLSKVTLADFKAPPANGAALNGNNPTTKKHDVKKGDVFVSVNGYRVENFAQYALARLFAVEEKMQFIVWDGAKYREFSAYLPGHRWNCAMKDFP